MGIRNLFKNLYRAFFEPVHGEDANPRLTRLIREGVSESVSESINFNQAKWLTSKPSDLNKLIREGAAFPAQSVRPKADPLGDFMENWRNDNKVIGVGTGADFESKKQAIFSYILWNSPTGVTAENVGKAFPAWRYSTVTARISELRKAGLIKPVGVAQTSTYTTASLYAVVGGK